MKQLKQCLLMIGWLLQPQSLWAQQPQRATITVEVAGINPAGAGKLVVCLFNSLEGFPREPQKALRRVPVSITGSTVRVELKDVEPGDYYISAFHDENNNGKPDANFINIPKEGVGASNDIVKKARFKPDYAKAKVHLHSGSQVIAFSLRYF